MIKIIVAFVAVDIEKIDYGGINCRMGFDVGKRSRREWQKSNRKDTGASRC